MFCWFFRFHKRFLSTFFICTLSCIPKTPGGSDLPPPLLIQVQLPSALFEILLIYMPDCRKSACILLKKVIKYRCLIFVPCIRMRFCRVCSAFCGFSFNRIQPHTRQIRQGGVTKWVSFVKYAVRAQWAVISSAIPTGRPGVSGLPTYNVLTSSSMVLLRRWMYAPVACVPARFSVTSDCCFQRYRYENRIFYG